jgi:hypothetical protein
VEPWEIAARIQINDTIAEYAHYVDRGQGERVAALFTPDGVLEAGQGQIGRGRDEITRMLSGYTGEAAGITFSRHNVTNLMVQSVSPEQIQTLCYFFVISDVGVDHCGRYRDVFVPADGRWLFAHRSVRLDMAPKWS